MTSQLSPSPFENAPVFSDPVPLASVSYMGSRVGGAVPGNAAALHDDGPAAGCNFGDRFDRATTLAYNFDDHHQLGFKMGTQSHGNGMEVSHAHLVFSWRFNTVPSRVEPLPKDKCRYASHWQGLVGSSYNELMLRENNSVWGEARDRGLDFWH